MRARAVGAGLGAAIVACAMHASANPLDFFGFGSRGAAMGGAAAADVRDFSANYYNPAGLALARGLELSLGYFRADHALKMNGRDNQVDPVKGLVFGLVAPGSIAGLPFAFGVGLHLPDDRISRVRALRQEQPRWELYDNRNQRLFLAANLALRPVSWLTVGGGLSFMSSTEGRLDISGLADILTPAASQLRHEVDADLTAVRYPQAGARVALGERAALAIAYRGEFRLRLDLGAHLHGSLSELTTALYQLDAHSVNNFLPQQVVVGGAWRVLDDVQLDVDLTWVNWAAYVPPVARIDATIDIPPPAAGWPPNVKPPSTPAPTRIAPLGMHDRVVPHIGLEWRAWSRGRAAGFLRAGYEIAKSPIAPQSGPTNYVDRDRQSVSFGLGARVAEPASFLAGDARLDLHAQYSDLAGGTTTKADPADLVGDYTATGHIWNLGATLTVGF